MDFTGERFIPGNIPPSMEKVHFARYEFASQFVSGLNVLDIACGTGYGTNLLASSGAKSVDGVDISHKAVSYCKDHYLKRSINFIQGDIYEYGTAETYDLITSFETIEHVEKYEKVLKNVV